MGLSVAHAAVGEFGPRGGSAAGVASADPIQATPSLLIATLRSGAAGPGIAALAGSDPRAVTTSAEWVCGQLRAGRSRRHTARMIATYSTGVGRSDAASFVGIAVADRCPAHVAGAAAAPAAPPRSRR
ncbi:MAG TPA: DUF732 domain-containing protein [Mycobacteriales bacterium]|nr:DUF732 domain-containing protein [Mycobacteriales bacterium]